MENHQEHSAVAIVALTAIALFGATAQSPGTPEDMTPLPGRSQQKAPVSKTDEHRVVGKVLEIDAERGLVKLASEEGILVVQPPPHTLRAFRVGDTVSVPRSGAEQPSASPRP